jgi:hypothetical protein
MLAVTTVFVLSASPLCIKADCYGSSKRTVWSPFCLPGDDPLSLLITLSVHDYLGVMETVELMYCQLGSPTPGVRLQMMDVTPILHPHPPKSLSLSRAAPLPLSHLSAPLFRTPDNKWNRTCDHGTATRIPWRQPQTKSVS